MGLAATRDSLTSYVVEFLPGFIHGISLVQDWGFEMTGRIYGLEIVLGSCAVNGLFLGFGYEPSRQLCGSDLIYWLCLVHLAIVSLLLVAFSVSGYGAFARTALCSTLMIYPTLLSYKVLDSRTVISNLLIGKRYPFALKNRAMRSFFEKTSVCRTGLAGETYPS